MNLEFDAVQEVDGANHNNNDAAQDEEDELDNIIKEFNDRWFKGWEATPEDQKTKLVSIAKAVIADADYQDLILGNPDKDAVEQIMTHIIDRVVRQKAQIRQLALLPVPAERGL